MVPDGMSFAAFRYGLRLFSTPNRRLHSNGIPRLFSALPEMQIDVASSCSRQASMFSHPPQNLGRTSVMSTKSKLEYIWLDGYKPTQSLRSKTRIESDFGGTLEECPMWSFDGSSTEQATGGDSDCLLKPVAVFPDPGRKNGYLVMTEVLNADGSPHESNGRATHISSPARFAPLAKTWNSHWPAATSALIPSTLIPASRQASRCSSTQSRPWAFDAPTEQ